MNNKLYSIADLSSDVRLELYTLFTKCDAEPRAVVRVEISASSLSHAAREEMHVSDNQLIVLNSYLIADRVVGPINYAISATNLTDRLRASQLIRTFFEHAEFRDNSDCDVIECGWIVNKFQAGDIIFIAQAPITIDEANSSIDYNQKFFEVLQRPKDISEDDILDVLWNNEDLFFDFSNYRPAGKTVYQLRVEQSGDVIDEFDTLEEARSALARYEDDDQRDGVFVPDFYGIVEAGGTSS